MAMVKKVPSKKSTGRRFQTVIPSPLIRRCLSTPVVLQGWLSKRGSEGLMLWKKRWCVLSDYCLFYYKDYEEEKLLGSFLVPSYKISVCGPEDKINRKYSFKAEHINMRTYYFAADNTNTMGDWIKALTLASLLQEMPRKATPEVNNISLSDERNDRNSTYTENAMSPNQPLYVNAPPKPRRLADSFVEDVQELQGPLNISLIPQHDHLFAANRVRSNGRAPILPTRPRSADLLAVDCTRHDEISSPIQQRPKSSLSRLTPPQTGMPLEPWSEQGYAEKMRRSSMYVAPKLHLMRVPAPISSGQYHQPRHPHPHPPLGQISKNSEFFDKLFKRSASARLPCMQEECSRQSSGSSTATSQEKADPSTAFTKTQQREESMKRLLEWKQRMLHSPLTQKSERSSHGQHSRGQSSFIQGRIHRENLLHHQTPIDDHSLTSRELECTEEPDTNLLIHSDQHYKKLRPLSRISAPDYTSLEGKKVGGSIWNSKTHSNTGIDTESSISNPEKNTAQSGIQPMYYNLRHLVQINEPGPFSISSSQNVPHAVMFSSQPSASDAGEYLKLDEAKVSSDSERDEEVAAVLCQGVVEAEPTAHRELTPEHEENYMPMSPRRKGSLENSCPVESLQALSPGPDESPYVEMTQKEGKSRINEAPNGDHASEKRPSRNEDAHFEVRSTNTNECGESLRVAVKDQSVSSAITEPLYMEVREKANDRHTLPDILNSAGSFNHGLQASDSSDADDEASKDLDSSDHRPRFSLSDTFRPASYYLGNNSGCESTLVPMDSDQQDSSDSDLVWPPPIPTTSPPLEHLDTSIDSINKSPLPFMNLTTGQRSVTPTSDEESVKWRRKTLKRRPLSADILSTLNEFGSECNKCESSGRNRVLSESCQSCEIDSENAVDELVRKVTHAPYYYSDLLKANQLRNDSGRQRQGRWRSLEGLMDGCEETCRGGAPNDPWASPEEGTVSWTDKQVNADRRTRSLEELDRQPQAERTLPLLNNIQYHRHSVEYPTNNDKQENTEEENLQIKIIANSVQSQSDHKERQHWNLKLSAGELLGRTHEELVLLLIQLRRQRARICKSMEGCHREIEAQKACLSDLDPSNRLDHLQRLEELKAHLGELEKQYEKGKPLVNLVDNMVKLGSLYQGRGGRPVPSAKLEFNHKVEEARLLAEERRDWERIHPDHHDLQAKVEQLYRLDKLLQEESGTLHSLQEDKGLLERALGGLKNKLQTAHGNSAETEWYRRQQRLLERELTRVRSILALNSKKLEETVAENGRLEQELVVLRQKLQVSRRSGIGTENLCGGIGVAGGTAALESELWRVQVLVGNLLRQRHELSLQVSQLTEKSNSLSQQMCPTTPPNSSPHHHLGINESGNIGKKHESSVWIETDLDTEETDTTILGPSASPRQQAIYVSPLYVNTESDLNQQSFIEMENYHEEYLEDTSSIIARSPELYKSFETEEDTMKRSHGLSWKDRPQEIKTVRIVKRESERRQRDRDRCGNLGIPVSSCALSKKIVPTEGSHSNVKEKFIPERLTTQLEPGGIFNETISDPPPPGPRSDSVNMVKNIVKKNKLKGNIFCGVAEPVLMDKSLEDGVGSSTNNPTSVISPQLSPVYLSETARRIVEEVAWQGRRISERRIVPREKRRHHTVSGPSISTQQFVYTERSSRDDLDMERVLRPRLTTPDVVRSTLHRPDTFTNETIDRLLGTPGKIVIPERYIPEIDEQPPTVEEKARRSRKATAIRKMLMETTTVTHQDLDEDEEKCIPLKDKVEEEKRNREHLLQLSQILAQEVMEKSKIVAGVSSSYNQD